MPTWTWSEIEAAVRSSWGPDTAFASTDYMARGSGRPSRGQCGTTSLVIQDLLGGDLMVADVEYEDRMEGVHYWNVTPNGVEVDLTREPVVCGRVPHQRACRRGRSELLLGWRATVPAPQAARLGRSGLLAGPARDRLTQQG